MPKAFEHKEAKELVNYYKNIFSDINKVNSINEKYKNSLLLNLSLLHKNKFFSKLIENSINNPNMDLDNNEIKTLIINIYYSRMSNEYFLSCNSFLQTYGKDIENKIKLLSSGSNAISWFFTSTRKKDNVEETFNELKEMRNYSFIQDIKGILWQVEGLKNTSYQIIKNDYIDNKNKYKEYLESIDKDIFNKDEEITIFKPYKNEYGYILNKTQEIENSIESNKYDIKESIKMLIADDMLTALRGVPVEELAREKSGIKTKYLMDAGYSNLADVYGASLYQIASIHGISQDKAYTIKSKCSAYANNLRNELKIKLSIDNKTKASTNVVKSLFTYLKKLEYLNKLNELNKEYGNQIIYALEELNKLGNGLIYLFLEDNQSKMFGSMFEFVKENLNTKLKPEVDNIYKEFKNNKINNEDAWNDFSINSIKYYNAIEEICPGVLGNDNSVYGLTEELAREIQDQCFFPDGLLCTLRKYQEWGVKYILHQEKVLLGDEMGLGKTIQAIATIVSLKNTGATHFLVICPASVVTNWCREVAKQSKLHYTKIQGTGKKSAFESWLKTGDVAVTNYESLTSIKLPEGFKIDLVIVDEAHYIKNVGARRSIQTREVCSHSNRLLFMTGTALENNVDEMITLIDVLRPSIASQVKGLAFIASAKAFRDKIAPVYYRRKREDVLTELPDKIENEEWCTLNKEEKEIYEKAILSKDRTNIRRVSWNASDLSKSCKAIRLKEIVEEAKKEGRKVLVFSFFLDTIAQIHEFLKDRCLNPINGSINVNRRQEIIDEFDKAPAGTVLLAQISSGGTGLNIQSASVVVICEPQFKPSIENQAISRAYRMGQSRNVLVYRLLCENTAEESMMRTLEEKQKQFDAFADKSVAAEQSVEISETKFGDIINEEIERIKREKGIPSEACLDVKEEIKRKPLDFELKNYEYHPIHIENTKEYYKNILNMTYEELVQLLINKYGPVRGNYFTNEYCTIKNDSISKTREGLFVHHIDEDKANRLSQEEFAIQNPFEYQKANRLVYCNLLEHFLLHILIASEPRNKHANKFDRIGIGGAVEAICPQLNDLYCGNAFQNQWQTGIRLTVINDYDIYVLMLKKLWNVILDNSDFKKVYSIEDLARGYNKNIYKNVLINLKN